MINLIDSHAHLYDYVQNETIDSILERAKSANISQIITIGTDIEDSEFYSKLTKDFDNIFYTMGIHPSYASNNNDIKFLENIITTAQKKPVAIGEIGLDYYSHTEDIITNQPQQIKLFATQLELAKKYNLPVVIHSRQAFEDTVHTIKTSGINTNTCIFHCFTYSEHQVKQLISLGVYVSFSGIVTYKNAKNIRDAFSIMPKDKIIIETDCPYLSPVPFRGKQNEPSFLRETAKFLAKEINLSEEEFSTLTFQNTIKAFNLNLN